MTWQGICFRKTSNRIDSTVVDRVKKHQWTVPSIDVLMAKSTTFFEAVMVHKAAIYINTIKQQTYNEHDILNLQYKKEKFYKSIQDILKGNASLIPTIEDATSDPENLYRLLRSYCYKSNILSKQDLYKITHNSDDFVEDELNESDKWKT